LTFFKVIVKIKGDLLFWDTR